MGRGTYGLCETCHEPIETDRLLADPLTEFCLDHLTPSQQRALEADLELASQIQKALLPQKQLTAAGWEVSYHYEGAGLTSGDYCDVIGTEDGRLLYCIIGDVKGKGLPASILMAHLHATFRALVSLDLPLGRLVERASRAFCESTLPTYFATLACVRVDPAGAVEFCNAGHLPPLLAHEGGITEIPATGLPVGMFCDEQFTVEKSSLARGDTIFLCTDGLPEAFNASGEEYGADRVKKFVGENHGLPPGELISACVSDLTAFLSGAPRTDDLTIMALRRL